MLHALHEYKNKITKSFNSGIATELTHYPTLKEFIEMVYKDITVIVSPKRIIDCGAPDFVVRHNDYNIGYIEAKDIGKDLSSITGTDQIKRYFKSLANLIITNYYEFRWYVNGTLIKQVSLTPSERTTKKEASELESLIQGFLLHSPERIKDSRILAHCLANYTHFIRDIIINAFEKNEVSEMLKDLKEAFKSVLIPDLSIVQFSDLFSQMLTYSFFAARCNQRIGTFDRSTAFEKVPKATPFLEQLLRRLVAPDLDEEAYCLFVDDLIRHLELTDIDIIFEERDPIIHFYETFLEIYDPKLREKRGVYYTPEPVATFIVRSVNWVLRNHFNIIDGLADASTIEYENQGKVENIPRVLILDPACGTGTFLYHIIQLIRDEFIKNNNAGLWHGYVENHLLQRLFGFELLMAPYVIAHLKIGTILAAEDMPIEKRDQWKYNFHSNERINVYLTNTLEHGKKTPPRPFVKFLTDEANAAVDIKTNLPIMVILGNPPYKAISSNQNSWIDGLLKGEIDGINYYDLNNQTLNEKKSWLKNDYIKFIRFSHHRIQQTGQGVIAFITGHGYLDRPTYRGMREKLFKSFSQIYIINLHGNTRSGENVPIDQKDENVFDIQQGVAISIFIKEPGVSSPAIVQYFDIWGTREDKNNILTNSDISSIQQICKKQDLVPTAPYYFFIPRDQTLDDEFNKGWALDEIFMQKSIGMVTSRDDFAMCFSKQELTSKISDFINLSIENAREKYRLGADSQSWSVTSAQEEIITHGLGDKYFQKVMYRPFDIRYTYYTGKTHGFISRPVVKVAKNMMKSNLGLLWAKPMSLAYEFSVLCTDLMADQCAIGNKSLGAGATYLGPLYLFENNSDEVKQNLNSDFIKEICQKTDLNFTPDEEGDLCSTLGAKDIFFYIYSILFCPTYKEYYREQLNRFIPRVPIISDLESFRNLVNIGRELVSLHLLKSPVDNLINYPVNGTHLVESIIYIAPGEHDMLANQIVSKGRLYINKGNTKEGVRAQYFDGVAPEVWNYQIGGYQVSKVWLDRRKNRKLLHDEIVFYSRILNILSKNIEMVDQLEELDISFLK